MGGDSILKLKQIKNMFDVFEKKYNESGDPINVYEEFGVENQQPTKEQLADFLIDFAENYVGGDEIKSFLQFIDYMCSKAEQLGISVKMPDAIEKNLSGAHFDEDFDF